MFRLTKPLEVNIWKQHIQTNIYFILKHMYVRSLNSFWSEHVDGVIRQNHFSTTILYGLNDTSKQFRYFGKLLLLTYVLYRK